MTTESDLGSLKRRRSTIKASCTRIKTYVDTIASVTPSVTAQLEERKIKLEQFWKEYNDTQTQLESKDEAEANDRAGFEEAFFDLSSKIRALTQVPSTSRGVHTPPPMVSSASDSRPAANVRLPKLDLPKFSGKYDEWFPFRDAFHSVIHSNSSLNDIHKLQYLRAATTDDAHKIISSLEISEENYAVAWNLLKERYDNKRIVVQNHVEAIAELPIMNKESASGLRQIVDGAARHIQALKALKRPIHYWDDVLIYWLSSKLDSCTTREWQRSLVGDELPTFKQFLDFLFHHCQVLESTQRTNGASARNTNSRSQVNSKQKTSCNTAVKAKCGFCTGEHFIYQCKQFLALTIAQRIENARSRKICLNCLRSTAHFANKCPSGTCKICSRKHNTLLHITNAADDQAKSGENVKQESGASSSAESNVANVVVGHSSNAASKNGAFLSTASVFAQCKDGSQRSCRVLLDSGSQANFVTKDFVVALGVAPRSIDISVSGISGTATQSNQAAQIKLRSRLNTFSFVIDCVVVDRITDDLPAFTVKRQAFDIPRNIPLADPQFNVSSGVDMLIGTEMFWSLICIGQIKSSDKHPTLQKTKLGWILAGKLSDYPSRSQRVTSLCTSVSNIELNDQLNKFWKMEEGSSSSKTYTLEEDLCEQHFVKTSFRNEQGRYVVQLPLKQSSVGYLGSSRDIALNRLRALERRLDKDPNLKSQYSNFIHEYIDLGHMRPTVERDINEVDTYYMPHHCVLREDAKSTKLRVVFDASCKTNSGLSLNDSMMVGPVIQEDLISMLLRFRTHRYVLVADIIKMYRQILVHPSQTKLQRILWRNDKTSDVQTFELVTVTYGTAAASYLATRCLLDLAERYENEFPLGSLHLKRNFYVDDMLTGADSKSEALAIRDQITQLLKLGSFELSKWGSNCPELLEGIRNQSDGLVPFDKESNYRILGTSWDMHNDFFRFSVNPEQPSPTITKRSILSELSKLFDPLGLLGPIIVVAKIILQNLWRSGLSWDESVPQNVHTRWLQFKLQLSNIDQLQIPRRVKYRAEAQFVQMHGYCDASERAYGACVYVRTQTGPDSYVSHLLCSRSRVAPVKAISLPRLELAAALLLSQLIDKIRLAIDTTDMRTLLWSDFTITLNWIASHSRRWSTFVANRVGEIQRLTEQSSWRHVKSLDNPADVLSRGMLPNELINLDLWWHGPDYLKLPEREWPSGEFRILTEGVPEQRVVCSVAVSSDCNVVNELIDKHSNLNKACRIVSYCLRFFMPKGSKPSTVKVSPQEISHSLNLLCKGVQRQVFHKEYDSLIRHESISSSSKLNSLAPFMKDDGLIRVGGRLKSSELSFDACHQIVLPRDHTLTKLIIENEHSRNMHSGVQATMASVRQRFWPLALRSTARKIINNCVTCFKARPVFSEALMGPLPAPRVTVSRPFSHCGVDYAGPVTLREGNRRNSRNRKAYIAVFVCFATKAVHLEVVSDLTTDAFIAALKRLISRRGKPNQMHSDNATTFVGAQRQLKELYEFLRADETLTAIEQFLQGHETTWKFIPPNAPHFGGLWEAAVKSAKYHLARIVGGQNLTFEEMSTVLCEIEAVLNSRPLVPLSADPNDMTYLSPGHFLVGTPLNSFPITNLSDINVNMLTRWQMIQQMREHFWTRWSNEYLHSLQERHKWQRSKGQQLEPGQLVIIKQQGLAPLQWLSGRVERVHLGADGIARSATVKTIKGSYDRPLSKLAVLPI